MTITEHQLEQILAHFIKLESFHRSVSNVGDAKAVNRLAKELKGEKPPLPGRVRAESKVYQTSVGEPTFRATWLAEGDD